MADWFDRNDLLAILEDQLVIQILQGTNHYNFCDEPVVPVDELNDRVALAQRDFDIWEVGR